MKPLSDCWLYAFVDTGYLGGRPAERVAEALCAGGADLIQLRAKGSSPEEVRRLAQAILPITRRAGIGLVVNDHFAVTREVGAEACHLGQGDFFGAGYGHVSALRPPGCGPLVGLSTHSPGDAVRAMAAGADYIAVGPVYATGTKPGVKPVTLELVRWAAANVRVPWFAIGGVSLETLDAVLAAGARRVCVVSAILNAPDVAGACRGFAQRLREARGAS